MNGVDCVDQMRITNPKRRKDKNIHMSLWDYSLDLVVHQSYFIYQKLVDEGKIKEYIKDNEDDECTVCSRRNVPYQEFKLFIREQLPKPLIQQNKNM